MILRRTGIGAARRSSTTVLLVLFMMLAALSLVRLLWPSIREAAERSKNRTIERRVDVAKSRNERPSSSAGPGRSDVLSELPIPANAEEVKRGEISGVIGIRYKTASTPAEVGLFYLDRLGDAWILVDSNQLAGSAQGWTGSFVSSDFSRKIYVFAIPFEISPTKDAEVGARVGLLVIPGWIGG